MHNYTNHRAKLPPPEAGYAFQNGSAITLRAVVINYTLYGSYYYFI